MARLRLLTEAGEDLGPFPVSQAEWSPGDVIERTFRGDRLIVVRLVDAPDDPDLDGYLVVRLESQPTQA
jgi:hypothetical protein